MRFKIISTFNGDFCLEAEATCAMTYSIMQSWAGNFSIAATDVVGSALCLGEIMSMPLGACHEWSFDNVGAFKITVERIV